MGEGGAGVTYSCGRLRKAFMGAFDFCLQSPISGFPHKGAQAGNESE